MAHKLRVLCLHGHRTNAKVMMNQTKGIRAALGNDTEFIFLDAPNQARGPTDPVIEKHHRQDAPFYEWWAVRPVMESDNVPMDDKRWSLYHDHIGDSLEFMEKKLQELGPVDVVLGFSQGAVLLTLLSMRYLQTKNKRMWKLCVCVGGVSVRAINHQKFFQGRDGRELLVPFPSIHIIGKTDPMHDESVRLAAQYDDDPTFCPSSSLQKRVYYHEGGHKFPSVKKYAAMYEEIAATIKRHCHACELGPAEHASRL